MKIPDLKATLSIFFFANVFSILLFNQGPNADEGIYIVTGLELLSGFSDSYSSWHNGSPFMWALLSGFIFSHSSFFTLRIFASLISTVTLFLTFKHCSKFISKEDSEKATFMLAIYGAFFSFAQLAVYDVFALFLFLAATVTVERFTKPSIFIGGLIAGFAIITKYAFFIFFPVLVFLVILLNRKEWFLNALVLCISAASVVIAHNLIVFDSLIPVSYSSYNAMKINFNSLYSLGICVFILLPFIILLVFSRAKIALTNFQKALFVLSLSIWPLFHLLTENPVSAQKHLMYGITFSAPLLVFSFKQSLISKPKIVIPSAILLFTLQYFFIFHSWSDLGPANKTLAENVTENSTIISNAGTYKTRFSLFATMPDVSEKLRNYHQLSDSERAEESPADFILWKSSKDPEAEKWMSERKKSYKKIESYTDFFIGAEDHLPWGFHTIEISVYQKID